MNISLDSGPEAITDENAAAALDILSPDLSGEPYLKVLYHLHKELSPKTYLEIGTYSGDSLALATCASIAVDPKLKIINISCLTNKPMCALYNQTSDDFFSNFDPKKVFGRPIDFAFLDGMHHCEYLLRDFINTEKFCDQNSTISLHDCVPVEIAITSRDGKGKPQAQHRTTWWTGDVWRTVWALKRYRPDLTIKVFDAKPTGLVLVTGLNPESTVLSDNYTSIVQAMLQEDLNKIGIENWQKQIGLMSTHTITSSQQAIQKIGVIEASLLVSGAEQGGMAKAVRIASPSTTEHRPPVYTWFETAPDNLKVGIRSAFSQRRRDYPERHLLTLEDVFIVGQGGVVVTDGARHNLLRDSALEYLLHDKPPPFMERGEGNTFAVNQPVHRRFDDDCLLLQRPFANNFGHWLIDQATVLSYLRHIGALRTNRLVVENLPGSRLREIMLQTIDAILPGAVLLERPISELWHFRNLDYCMPVRIPPSVTLPAALECLRRDILAAPAPDIPLPRRIYVTRNRGSRRRLVNEPEIMALAARHGFEPVSPENLSITEQAALFSNAEAVLGVKGAAMTNILFGSQNCSLMVMSPPRYIDQFFYDIASIRGVAYSEVFGEAVTVAEDPFADEFRVNPKVVEEMIIRTAGSTEQPGQRQRRFSKLQFWPKLPTG